MGFTGRLPIVSCHITGDLQKTGTGTLVLSGDNNLTSLEITEGTVSINNTSNLGTDTVITLDGGALTSTSTINSALLHFSEAVNETTMLSSAALRFNARTSCLPASTRVAAAVGCAVLVAPATTHVGTATVLFLTPLLTCSIL